MDSTSFPLAGILKAPTGCLTHHQDFSNINTESCEAIKGRASNHFYQTLFPIATVVEEIHGHKRSNFDLKLQQNTHKRDICRAGQQRVRLPLPLKPLHSTEALAQLPIV
jgi:hypothetical protein